MLNTSREPLSLPTAQAVVETGGMAIICSYPCKHTRPFMNGKDVLLWIHLQVRDDLLHLLYGFATRDEREIFRLLIGVTGVGPNTARMVLSAMSNAELRNAIVTGDVVRISIKGIGTKTAERMIIDLRDKMMKIGAGPRRQGTGSACIGNWCRGFCCAAATGLPAICR